MIDDYHFGQIRVGGKSYNGDIKIVSGEVISGWWRKEGHALDISDIEDILSTGPETLVVGMGDPGYMKVRDALRGRLARMGVVLIEEPTARAVRTFNDLFASGRKVAGAFHLTC
ncbi:MAG: MTH938/NDUFAF3 family protein [Syntrophobacteraceae bacterium]